MPSELSAFNIAVLVLLGLIAVFAAVFFYYYRRHIYHSKHVVPRTLDWVFLEIMVPKDNADEKEKPKTPDEKKLLIAVAEQLFTTLSESGHSRGWLQGKDYYSFEIACTDKKIS